ncbi:metal ABC transporter permease [Corynebacterium kroppenstedtii]|uniref:metal ABC transporter permease n=1 Tax=Corynebacterium sp. PCR 32 TaxID=3351342 RepID=UPI0030AC5CFF
MNSLALAGAIDSGQIHASLATTLIEPFTFSFMQRAVIVTSVTALCTGLLSAWIILLGWSLLGDAISHAVLPGVVISYIIGIPFSVGALVAAVLTVSLIGTIRGKTNLKDDTAIGIVFTTFFALGLVLISVTPSTTDLHSILFGNLLGVRQSALIQVVVIALLASALVLVKRRDITLWSFDPINARSLGINPMVMRGFMLTMLALVIVASMQAVGVILVVAMLITPGAISLLVFSRMRSTLIWTPVISWITAMSGLLISYWTDVSSGGMIVVVQGCAFMVVFAAKHWLSVLRHRAHRSETAV